MRRAVERLALLLVGAWVVMLLWWHSQSAATTTASPEPAAAVPPPPRLPRRGGPPRPQPAAAPSGPELFPLTVADPETNPFADATPMAQPGRPTPRDRSIACGRPVSATRELDFTLCLQCSADRLWMLERIADRWAGPISAAVYVRSVRGDAAAVRRMEEELARPNVKITTLARESAREDYPVNRLRNVAIDQVRTTHYLYTDVDLWPDSGLYERLRRRSTEDRAAFVAPEHAFVVPAFEMRAKTGAELEACVDKESCEPLWRHMPRTRRRLDPCVRHNRCRIFYASSRESHYSSDYARWWEAAEDDPAYPVECIIGPRYEPYLVLRHCGANRIRYDEHFTGYGKNKIQFALHLRAAGMRFFVLPHSFVVHFPHQRSAAKERWIESHRKQDRVYGEFYKWLKRNYGTQHALPYCTDAAQRDADALKLHYRDTAND